MNYTLKEDTVQLKRPCQRVIASSNGIDSSPQYFRDVSHRDSAIKLAVSDLAERLGTNTEDLTLLSK